MKQKYLSNKRYFNSLSGNNEKSVKFYIKRDLIGNIDNWCNSLSTCEVNERYSILVRLSYISNSQNSITITDWKTLGSQIYFTYTDSVSLQSKVEKIKSTVLDRYEYTLEFYSIQFNEVLGLQFLAQNVSYNNVVKQINPLQSLDYHKDLINVSATKKSLDLLTLPYNHDYPGVSIEKIVNNGFVDKIILPNGEDIDFYKRIKEFSGDIKPFTKDAEFYLINKNEKKFITTVETKSNQNSTEKNINIYNTSGGNICNITDTFGIKDNSYKRNIGNITFNIDKDKNNSVISKEILQNFNPIKPKKIDQYKLNAPYSDYKFGVLDLETYVNKYGISKVYCLGFYTKNNVNIYYVDKSLDSESLIIKCIDSMLKEKYNNYSFYVHNLGRFDITFLLKVIISLHESQPHIYNFNLILRDSVIICMDIYKTNYYYNYKNKNNKRSKKTFKIKLVDSYNILHSSLNDLCKTYKPTNLKSNFPYNFIKENTLFYEGSKPNIKYYDNISEIEYNKITENWSTEKETFIYLKNDLTSLFEIMEKFIKYVWLHYGIHVTDSYTISGLSMNIFLNKFYGNNIPLINKKSVFNDLKDSYYGGMTEVYKPYGENLYYYDVNSLYPYAALNPMPGVNCVYIDSINTNIKNYVDNMFGFYYCSIETTNDYLGLIPVRQDNGSVFMPNGSIKGWYFSEELKFAYQNGYNIDILHGYKFDKCYDVFKKYIDTFYKIKSNTTDIVEKATTKSLLNNLLGRFGMDINKPKTRLVNLEEYKEILQIRKIVGDVKFIGNKVLITYNSEISPDICKDHDVNFKETYYNLIDRKDDNNKFKEEQVGNVSVCISSAITSYSRIFMNKIKLDLLKSKANIFYTDTDSIITDKPLDNNLVGKDLGQFKLEHLIKKGYFITNKTYCILDNNDNVIIKVKGVNENTLTIDDFKKMYLGSNVGASRFESIRNYSEGYTNVKISRDITLSSTAYKKRDKIFNGNNIWIDTKPLTINK